MKTFHCDKCSHQIFFENTLCFNCESTLGYQPATRSINAFEPTETGQWRSLHRNDEGKLYKQCSNYVEHNVCNWMLPADDPHDLCASCQLTASFQRCLRKKTSFSGHASKRPSAACCFRWRR